MITRKNILFTIFIHLSFLLAPVISIQAAQVHAILVADTLAGHAPYMENNIDSMQREAKRIAAYTDLPLHVALFEHYEVRIENILDYIEKLNVQSDDIVIFYINNHGSRLQDKNNKWPDILFSLNHYLTPDRPKIDFQEFSEALKNKNPAFLLAIAESCNSISDPEEADEKNNEDQVRAFALSLPVGPTTEYSLNQDDKFLARLRDSTEDDKISCYKNLFSEKNGAVLISSSNPGEVAIFGIFTPMFLETLYDMGSLRYPNCEWKEILTRTGEKVQDKYKTWNYDNRNDQKTQTIQYDLQLKISPVSQ